MALTQKQQKFADYYIELSNSTEAAKRAGYSEKTAYSIGFENLKKPEILAYIEKRLKEIEGERVASIAEVMQFYTKVMRGEEKDQFGLDASLTDRIRAGQELLKRLTITDEKPNTENNMQTLADLINAPQPNRNIADFEDNANE